MVINALCDHTPHVPYRDSKLTMILMDALGGNSKTTLIICCNPEIDHTPESLTTLRFGERAKRIKNNAKVSVCAVILVCSPTVQISCAIFYYMFFNSFISHLFTFFSLSPAQINEELSAEELKVLLAAAKKEIALLKRKLAGITPSGKLCVLLHLLLLSEVMKNYFLLRCGRCLYHSWQHNMLTLNLLRLYVSVFSWLSPHMIYHLPMVILFYPIYRHLSLVLHRHESGRGAHSVRLDLT